VMQEKIHFDEMALKEHCKFRRQKNVVFETCKNHYNTYIYKTDAISMQ
jgi:hypothetical protein